MVICAPLVVGVGGGAFIILVSACLNRGASSYKEIVERKVWAWSSSLR